MENVINIELNSFKYGEEYILKDIKLDVKKGELLVISGYSGCGKTTLLRHLNRLIPDLYEGLYKGNIKILSKNIMDYKSGELAKHIGNVFQNPNDQFFSTNAENEIALVGENLGMEQSILINRVEKAIDSINIKDLTNKSVYELSGGEKQKVAIASSLIYDTEIIIFDEPSASLDYKAIEELKNIMSKLKKEGKTLIVAEHRLYYLASILDRLVIMKDGKIDSIYDKEFLNEEIRIKHDLRVFREESLIPEVEFIKKGESIIIKDLKIENKGFKVDYKINISLCLGECMGVIGKNGCGKTTFAKQLVGLLPIKEGYTSFGKNNKERLKNSSIVLQHSTNIFFNETVEKELINKSQLNDKEYLEDVKRYLIEIDLWDKRGLNPQDLSQGEKQRLAIIIAMLKKSKLLILDEPTSGLDYKRMNLVANSIKKYCKNTPCIMITHDLEVLFKSCNTVLILNGDSWEKIIVKGNEEKIFNVLKELKNEGV